MDFLDPQKKRTQRITLLVGYILVAIAIAIGTLILVFASNGYGLDRQTGAVIQNGLVFVASQPETSDVYIDGKLRHGNGNARLVLPAGQYNLELKRSGYRTWHRAFTLDGGSVERFIYPLLFPDKLTSSSIQSYNGLPGLVTQSPDRHWLLAEQPGNILSFDSFDLTGQTKPPTLVTLPASLLTNTSGDQHWAVVEWSNDNRHVLLQHFFASTSEFILLDREVPATSINLSQTLNAGSAAVSLRDKKFDQYFLFDSAAATLTSAQLKNPTPVPLLTHVLAFKAFAGDFVLYTTDDLAPPGKVMVKVWNNTTTYSIRELSAQPPYLLDIARYSNRWYVVAGDSGEGRAYVYREPFAALASQPTKALVPATVLKVPAANHLSFSINSRFVALENTTKFAVYDAETDRTHNYELKFPLDSTLPAQWMDGYRLVASSNAQTVVFDYDGTNPQLLTPTATPYSGFFTPDYSILYNLAPTKDVPNQFSLTRTSLKAP